MPPSLQNPSTVHDNRVTGDVAGRLRSKKDGGIGDVVGLSVSIQRNVLQARLVFDRIREHVPVDRGNRSAGRDAIDPDPVDPPLQRGCLSELRDGSFRGRVDRTVAGAGATAG